MKLTPSNLAYILYCASIVTAAPTIKRQSGTTYDGGLTANDVENGVCAPLTLIFARGSTEQRNMGSSVGPALAKELISQLGNDGVAIQGVNYSATISSNLSMGSDGGPELAKLAQQALQNCPNTKIAISGYSQGATVCHYAVAQGGLDASGVTSAVLYGDPLDGQSVGDLPSSRLKEFCAAGDGVCESHTFAITAAHLSYTTGSDIPEGAQFIVQNAGATTSGGSSSSGTSSAAAVGASASPTSPFGGLTSGSTTNPFGGLTSGTTTNPFGGLTSGSSTNPFGSLTSGSSTNPFGSLSSLGFGSGGFDVPSVDSHESGSGIFGRASGILKRFI